MGQLTKTKDMGKKTYENPLIHKAIINIFKSVLKESPHVCGQFCSQKPWVIGQGIPQSTQNNTGYCHHSCLPINLTG